jgi:hypothetical protein
LFWRRPSKRVELKIEKKSRIETDGRDTAHHEIDWGMGELGTIRRTRDRLAKSFGDLVFLTSAIFKSEWWFLGRRAVGAELKKKSLWLHGYMRNGV